MSSTKIIEFYYVKLPKSLSSKYGVWKEFIEDSSGTFSRKWVLQKREFSYPFFQSMSYKNVVVAKQIYLSTRFLKSWIAISDNICRSSRRRLAVVLEEV